jgi:hypothetical protein
VKQGANLARAIDMRRYIPEDRTAKRNLNPYFGRFRILKPKFEEYIQLTNILHFVT